ncbi:MAG: hypothetical protein HUK14_10615 [Muribaculaceae bacterium]|nr:hypothetical protein [Muribaculaceae bacterium]
MKKLYSILAVAALTLLTALSARADFSFKVVIDNTDAVQVCQQVWGETSLEYIPYPYGPDGAEITCDGDWMSIYFVGAEGVLYNIYEATPGQSQEDATLIKEAKTGVYALDLGSIQGYNPDGYTYYVVSYTNEPDSKITVNFSGDLSKVDCFTIQDKTYDLVEGTQVFEYNSKLASFASLMLPLFGPKAIYSVKYDGVEVDPTTLMGDFYQYTFRDLKSAKEHTVDINTEYPDVKYNFVINTTAGCEDFISAVLVNGEKVAEYSQIAAGAEVQVFGNDVAYVVNSFTVNASPVMFMQSWSTIVNRDFTLDFDLTAAASFTVNVNVNKADAVTATCAGETLALAEGDNAVKVYATSNLIEFAALEGYEILSITLDGTPIDGTSGWIVDDMKSGSNIVVTVNDESGIDTLSADDKADTTIFNLQGVAMGKDLNSLPAGLYITNGKKVVKF